MQIRIALKQNLGLCMFTTSKRSPASPERKSSQRVGEVADISLLGVSSLDATLMLLATSNVDFRQRLWPMPHVWTVVVKEGIFPSSGTAQNGHVISHVSSALTCR